MTPAERFWAKVVIDDEGHWRWGGAKSITRGRFIGFFRNEDGSASTAHYWAWTHLSGPEETPILPDTQIRRTCNVDECVNPAHYRMVYRLCDRPGCKLAFHYGEENDPIVYHKSPPKAKDLIKNPPTPPAWVNEVLAKANKGAPDEGN